MNKNKHLNIVIIGGGVAGVNVIYRLMKAERQFNITCITQEKYFDYSTCGIPFVLGGIIENPEDLILHKHEFFSEKGVKLLMETEVTDIDPADHQITILNKAGENEQLQYDRLVIATGRVPFKPPIPGIELQGVHTLMNLEQCKQLLSAISLVDSAVVVGGGAIGLEAALAFNTHKLDTTLIEVAPSVLPMMLDPDMAKLVEEWLTGKGIKIHTNSKVQQIVGADHVEFVILEDGTKLPTKLVLLAAGIRPNVTLAKKAGLDIGLVGGIVTDDKQNVYHKAQSIENVFALGDCVETKSLLTGQQMLSPLASTCIQQARTIVHNILGMPSEFRGSVNPTMISIDDLQVGAVGLTAHAAKRAGLVFKSATSTGKSNSRYIPGWKELHFKFLGKDGKIIGAQIIGETDVKERINALTLAIRENISIKTMLQTERCYTPPLGLLIDPMFKALEKLI